MSEMPADPFAGEDPVGDGAVELVRVELERVLTELGLAVVDGGVVSPLRASMLGEWMVCRCHVLASFGPHGEDPDSLAATRWAAGEAARELRMMLGAVSGR